MKKVFIAIFFLLLVFASCRAESGIKYIDAQVDGNKLNEANTDLSQIEIDFCDKPGEKAIAYTVMSRWNQDICLKASNVSDKGIQVTIGFVDGTVTQDQRKNKACMQQWEDNKFWQWVTWFLDSFTIPAHSFVFQHAKLTLPKWATWIINWCLIYYTKSVEMGGGLNFSVLMRKAKFIDIHVKENIFFEKYFFWILSSLLLLYYAKVYLFANKKKPPKR